MYVERVLHLVDLIRVVGQAGKGETSSSVPVERCGVINYKINFVFKFTFTN